MVVRLFLFLSHFSKKKKNVDVTFIVFRHVLEEIVIPIFQMFRICAFECKRGK